MDAPNPVFDATGQRFGIPAGIEAAPGLSGLNEASACGHDAAALHPVLDDGSEGSAANALGVAVEDRPDVFKVHIEVDDLLAKPLHVSGLAVEDGLPDSGHIVVQFAQKDVFGQALSSGRQARHCPTREGFHKHRGRDLGCRQPLAHLWDKPRLAARIAERTELANLRNVRRGFLVVELFDQ